MSIENFPELHNSQVALLRADTNTGHVLDEELNLAVNDHQKVFTRFDDAEIALVFAKSLILQNTQLECVIYTKGKKVLYHIGPEHLNL